MFPPLGLLQLPELLGVLGLGEENITEEHLGVVTLIITESHLWDQFHQKCRHSRHHIPKRLVARHDGSLKVTFLPLLPPSSYMLLELLELPPPLVLLPLPQPPHPLLSLPLPRCRLRSAWVTSGHKMTW